jgi:hypothetical protein
MCGAFELLDQFLSEFMYCFPFAFANFAKHPVGKYPGQGRVVSSVATAQVSFTALQTLFGFQEFCQCVFNGDLAPFRSGVLDQKIYRFRPTG